MTDAPERLYLQTWRESPTWVVCAVPNDGEPDEDHGDIEYVRADLYAALEQKLDMKHDLWGQACRDWKAVCKVSAGHEAEVERLTKAAGDVVREYEAGQRTTRLYTYIEALARVLSTKGENDDGV